MNTHALTSPSPNQGGRTSGPAKLVLRCSLDGSPVPKATWAWVRWAVLSLGLALTGCSSAPPAPDWQVNAKSSIERAAEAGLRGDSRIEAAEFARARAEVARTGQPAMMARVELLRCATRVASLDFAPCRGFDALAADAAPPEQAYASYLAGAATPTDAALLPEAHRDLVSQTATPEAALAAITDPLSRLIAASVLLRRGQATPGVIEQAVGTASSQGWRRPLLAWLGVQQQRAQAAGAEQEAARILRRIRLIAPPTEP
jgi:hypothetical protein